MARRISLSRQTRRAGLAAAIALALTAFAFAQAAPPPQGEAAPATPMSKSCQPGAQALAGETALPNVAAALAQRKTLRILAFGAAPGRVTSRGGSYTGVIEAMLAQALKGMDVTIVNRGVSGELAAGAAVRMRNEVALEEPDLVLWQVGTNDALAYVPVADFSSVLSEQIAWLKAHHVDLVLVGLQFTPRTKQDEHYVAIRETLRKIAAAENVPVVRFYEAMQIVNGAQEGQLPAAEEFERNEEGYNCLAQYVARAITLGVFAKNMPARTPREPLQQQPR
jgi:lysophospholipase L1-like esterase